MNITSVIKYFALTIITLPIIFLIYFISGRLDTLFFPFPGNSLPKHFFPIEYLIVFGPPIILFVCLQSLIIRYLFTFWKHKLMITMGIYTIMLVVIYILSDEIAFWMKEYNIFPFNS